MRTPLFCAAAAAALAGWMVIASVCSGAHQIGCVFAKSGVEEALIGGCP